MSEIGQVEDLVGEGGCSNIQKRVVNLVVEEEEVEALEEVYIHALRVCVYTIF